MGGQIFISYRRDEASAWARLVNDRLLQHFPETKIFIDVDTIEPGVDFVEAIEEAVGGCDVLIAVIGNRWLTSSDPGGRRRLEIPEDSVRIEVATALKRGIRVIPVLVDGALMPQSSDLPDDLKSLARRNALEVSHSRFRADSERLIAAVKGELEKTAAKRQKEEKERLEAERLEAQERARLHAKRRETEKKERLEAVRRQKEEQDRLETEQRQREEAERMVQSRECEEKERLERREPEGKKRLQAERRQLLRLLQKRDEQLEEKERVEPKRRRREPSAKPTAPVAVVTLSPAIIQTPSAEEQARRVLEKATKEQPWQNSLGMKFVPVAGTQMLFSVWDTRVQDFEAFVADTNYDATGGMFSLGKDGWKQGGATWREPGFSQGPTHPVVGVSWNDAKKFCEWLMRREQASGRLPRGWVYRLPTDAEWSVGVGLQGEEGNNPKKKNRKIKLYPRDKEWPPPKGAGNYAGEESKIGEEPSDWVVIKGYNDGYPRTSPVGSFVANANGLYDMGGNISQTCEDWYDATEEGRVLRGASWVDNSRGDLLASIRLSSLPGARYDHIGFRCVVGAESSR